MKTLVTVLSLVVLGALSAFAAGNPIRIDLALNTHGDPGRLQTSLVSQGGQKVEGRAGGVVFEVAAQSDEAGVITTTTTLFPGGDGTVKGNAVVMPVVKSMSGQPVQIAVGDHSLQIVATVVEARTFTIDFPGGTLGELIAVIEQGANPTFNLITSKDQLALPVPAFSVRSAGVGAFSEALQRMLRPHGLRVTPVEQRVGITATRHANVEPVFVLDTESRESQPAVFDVLPIEPLLDRYTPEDIVDAIQTAWALDPARDAAAASLKYHPATKLLFVVGTRPGAVEVARMVYGTLLQGSRSAETERAVRAGRVAEEIQKRREQRMSAQPPANAEEPAPQP